MQRSRIIAISCVFLILGVLVSVSNNVYTNSRSLHRSHQYRREALSNRLANCEMSLVEIKVQQSSTAARVETARASLFKQVISLEKDTKLIREVLDDEELKACRAEREQLTGVSFSSQQGGGVETNGGEGVSLHEAEVGRLQYSIKRLKSAIETVNATRMTRRAELIKLIEALTQENRQLSQRLEMKKQQS
jgi:hypothetical protein